MGMTITEAIRKMEKDAANTLEELPAAHAKIASIEVAKRLLSGAVNGKTAQSASTVAVNTADQLVDLMQALFQRRRMLKKDALDCMALIMDACGMMVEGMQDEGSEG